jgi:hypothetical protein
VPRVSRVSETGRVSPPSRVSWSRVSVQETRADDAHGPFPFVSLCLWLTLRMTRGPRGGMTAAPRVTGMALACA